MSEPLNIAAYSDALVVLGTAGLVVPVMRRLGVNPVLGYLAAGAVLGPLGLGSFIGSFPLLYWFTVVDPDHVSGIAELGVVFLLFLIGLELSFARLMTMRRLVFGFGASQVIATGAIIAGGLTLLGTDPPAAAVLGACLSLSSTAMVVEMLSSGKRLATSGGRAAFSVLLAQDLAVVPIFLMVAALSGGAASIFGGLVSAVAQAAVALVVIGVAGRLLLRPFFRLVASARSPELFMAAILFVIVATGVIAGLAGVSMGLGAFVAGLLLAETEYRKSVQAIIEPFKGLLLGVFFFTVGMGIDLAALVRDPLRLMLAVAALILLKALVVLILSRLVRLHPATGLEVALMLGPAGEFAFVGIGAAMAAGVVTGADGRFALTAATLSMALVPALVALSGRIEAWFGPVAPAEPHPDDLPGHVSGHAIVIGYGRVGKVVCGLLAAHKRPYLAVDADPVAVSRERRQGQDVYYGDATSASFLSSCGLSEAAAVVITVAERAVIDEVVALVRAEAPHVPIFSRARDGAHARHLYAIGVSDAVPETVEASLQLSETALVGIGVPMGPVLASIHDRRDAFRKELQAAGRRAR